MNANPNPIETRINPARTYREISKYFDSSGEIYNLPPILQEFMWCCSIDTSELRLSSHLKTIPLDSQFTIRVFSQYRYKELERMS